MDAEDSDTSIISANESFDRIACQPVLEATCKEKKFQKKHNIEGTGPQIQEELSARYGKSFAYVTFRKRSPQMLLDLIESVQNNKELIMKKYGSNARHDIRHIVCSLELLREELLENRPFRRFYVKGEDFGDWNRFLENLPEERFKWFSAVWLHAECYLYRRISSIFQRSDFMSKYDYFGPQKRNATYKVAPVALAVLNATSGLTRSKQNFELVLKLSLWGNRCDLSLTQEQPDEHIVEMIQSYNKDLLVDDSDKVWQVLENARKPVIVDIVCDNAGYELFTDLILAEHLIESGLARKVRFHVKAIPWFVSDVTAKDFHWMLGFFRKRKEFNSFGEKMCGFMKDGFIELCGQCYFWTSAHAYCRMRELLPCLYVKLSESALAIFKGDLNYRKLLGDVSREYTDDFIDGLNGFLPTSVCALRAIKSDIYCGMPICAVEWLTEDDRRWMLTGEKSVIQLARKPYP